MTNRRAFILGLGATLAVIRTPGLLMPIKPVLADGLIAYVGPDQRALDIIDHLANLRRILIEEMIRPPMMIVGRIGHNGSVQLADIPGLAESQRLSLTYIDELIEKTARQVMA